MSNYLSDFSGSQIDTIISLFHNKGLNTVTGLVQRNADGTFSVGQAVVSAVTSVATGDGLTGGPITSTGTVKANLRSFTKLTNDSAAATEVAGRVYPVVLDKTGYLAVNVPWTGTITGITMNGVSKGTSGVVNLGTVITSHQDISGKADKNATVSTVTYDTTNKKITKTINGTTSDVVTVATLKSDLGSMPASDVSAWAKASTKPSYTFSEIGSKPTTISGYGITDAYTKNEIDGKLSGAFHYKGSKSAVGDLPTTGNTTGDVWHINADGSEYAWNGESWEFLGKVVDLSGYVPTSRTINNKALTGNISLTASDVGALPSTHTYAASLASDTGTSTITLAYGGKYKLTAGGNSVIFTMPASDNTWRSISDAVNSTASDVSASSKAVKTAYDLAASKTSNTGTVTSVAASGSGGITISGSPITTSGTIAIGLNLSTAINGLGEGSSAATRDDFIVAQYAGGGTTTTTYHRRTLAHIFEALNKSDITTALGATPIKGGSNASSTVTITPSTTAVYSMTSAGSVTAGTANVPTKIDTTKFSGGSYSHSGFSGGSFTRGSFSGGSLSMAIDGTDSKKLNITFTAATHGADSFTAASYGTDSFTAASLGTGFYTAGTANVPTAVTLPGRSSKIDAWTGYTAASAAAQTFTGTSV